MSDNVIRIHKGEMPIILTAPHSGRHKYHYPERKHGVFCDDDCTKELLHDVSEAMYNKFGFRPYRIRTRLARVVCELNRAEDETHNSPEAMQAYFQYHAAIEDSIRDSISRFGFAVLFDIHGQEHRPCLELGYGVTTDQLAAGDNVISTLQPGECTIASIPAIQQRNGRAVQGLPELVRGGRSLGSRLVHKGWRAIPSDSEPTVDKSESKHYFWGAHTVRHYTKEYPEHVVAIQLESPMVWRKDEALRRTYAEALAETMVDFVKEEMLPLQTAHTSPDSHRPH